MHQRELRITFQKFSNINQEQIQDFSRGWNGCRNQWSIFSLKHVNLRIGTLLKSVIPQILAIPQSRNYNEVPFQSVYFSLQKGGS